MKLKALNAAKNIMCYYLLLFESSTSVLKSLTCVW